MNILFWRKKKDPPMSLETLAWNLTFSATDPDKCWETASNFRRTRAPSNVVTCELSFLMGSICRDIIRKTVRPELQERAFRSAEKSYAKVFQDASEEDMPPEMLAVYGGVPLSEVANRALQDYGREDDFLHTTVRTFVHRIQGDPRMAFEIRPLIEEREQVLRSAFVALLAAAR